MKFTIGCTVTLGFLLMLGLQTGWAGTPSGHEHTYTGPWRATADIVDGWDWTLPSGVGPAQLSGMFNFNRPRPEGFSGNHLKQINAEWRDLEPTPGRYNFDQLIDEINDPTYDGVMLNVRGLAWAMHVRECTTCAVAEKAGSRTAPDWLSGAPTVQEAWKTNEQPHWRMTNLKISDSQVKTRLLALISAFGAAGIPANPRLKAAIIHGVSSSTGEEWTGKQVTPEGTAAMSQIVQAWSDAYGVNARKLAWRAVGDTSLYNAFVVKGSLGLKGGGGGKFLSSNMTPGADFGQSLTADGYLVTDESHPLIADPRHFQYQDEQYAFPRFLPSYGPEEGWPMRYRLNKLRALQQQRNLLWSDKTNMNPKMLNWVSLQLGKNIRNAPDAWVLLFRSWVHVGGENREINNLERWLYQRESAGATTPTINKPWGYNANGGGGNKLPENLWNGDLARMGRSIGIAIDDRFLVGGPHAVAIKVTYYDTNSGQWSLVYNTPTAKTARSVKNANTGKLRTATFFLDDFTASERDKNPDFALQAEGPETPFSFVRLIKLSHAPPAPPEELAVVP